MNVNPRLPRFLAGSAPKKRYVFEKQLIGHSSGVYALAANFSGTLLASGGYDGTLIWDLEKYKQVAVPIGASTPRGQVTTLRWVTGRFDLRDTLCIGTSLGWLAVWREDLDSKAFEEIHASPICPKEITDIHFDKFMDEDTFRICVAGRDGIVQVWTFGPNQQLSNTFSVQTPISKPRSIGFIEDNSLYPKVRLLGRMGNMMVLDHTGSTIDTKSLGHEIGYGDAHDEKRLFIADAGSEYKLYCMDTNMKYLRSFPTPTHGSRFPRQVTFGESENVVVGGSKEGTVYVFDTKTGASLDVLHHSSARVLAVATYKRTDKHFIVAASSEEESAVMFIWSYIPPSSRKKRARRRCLVGTSTSTLAKLGLSVLALGATFVGVDYLYMREESLGAKLFSLDYLPQVREVARAGAWSTSLPLGWLSQVDLPTFAQPYTSAPTFSQSSAPACNPVTTCQSSLSQLQDEIDEWKWYSREGSQGVLLLREENKQIYAFLDSILSHLKELVSSKEHSTVKRSQLPVSLDLRSK